MADTGAPTAIANTRSVASSVNVVFWGVLGSRIKGVRGELGVYPPSVGFPAGILAPRLRALGAILSIFVRTHVGGYYFEVIICPRSYYQIRYQILLARDQRSVSGTVPNPCPLERRADVTLYPWVPHEFLSRNVP